MCDGDEHTIIPIHYTDKVADFVIDLDTWHTWMDLCIDLRRDHWLWVKNMWRDSWRHVVSVSFNSFHLPYYFSVWDTVAQCQRGYSNNVLFSHRGFLCFQRLGFYHTINSYVRMLSLKYYYGSSFIIIILLATANSVECIVKYENVFWIVDSRQRHRWRRQHRDETKTLCAPHRRMHSSKHITNLY